MATGHPPPSLVLSDIIHTSSLSPPPNDATPQDGQEESGSIEPSADLSQLENQAETIIRLTAQRDFLIAQKTLERERWDLEREGWDRSAEALLAQRNQKIETPRNEDLERRCMSYESDNRALRAKLQDTQSRLTVLEHEVLRLKPLLLMQPTASSSSSLNQASSYLSSLPFPSTPSSAVQTTTRRRKKAVSNNSSMLVPEGPMDGPLPDAADDTHLASTPRARSIPNDGNPPFRIVGPQPLPSESSTPVSKGATKPSMDTLLDNTPTQSSKQAHSFNVFVSHNVPQPQPPPHNATKKRSRNQPLLSLTSDARTEHLLLAARRIGRERAGVVAGINKAETSKPSKGKGREEFGGPNVETFDFRRRSIDATMASSPRNNDLTATPKTPKRAPVLTEGPGANHYIRSHYEPTGNLAAAPNPGAFVFVSPGVSDGRNASTTRKRGTGRRKSLLPQDTQLSVPTPTRLDSLLNAARSMMETPTDQTPQNMSSNMIPLGDTPSSTRTITPTPLPAALQAGPRRRELVPEEPESPVPKRRKVGSDVVLSPLVAKGGGGRFKSALDVLADQAAAFSSTGLEEAASGVERRGKGKPNGAKDKKGKGRAIVAPEDDLEDAQSISTASTATNGKSQGRAERARMREKRASDAKQIPFEPPSSNPDRGREVDEEAASSSAEFRNHTSVKSADVPRLSTTPLPQANVSGPNTSLQISHDPPPHPEYPSSSTPALDVTRHSSSPDDLGTSSNHGNTDDDLDRDADGEQEVEDQASQTDGQPPSRPELPAPVTPSSPIEEIVDVIQDADADPDADAEGEEDAEGEMDIDADEHGVLASSASYSSPMGLPFLSKTHQSGSGKGMSGSVPALESTSEPGSSSMARPVTLPRDKDHLVPHSDDVPALGEDATGDMYPTQSENGGSKPLPGGMSATVSQDSISPGKKPRSAYVKWTEEEDRLLVEAVAKHGQKWDLVKRALPNRGYHQVRQRWLRKLGSYTSKSGEMTSSMDAMFTIIPTVTDPSNHGTAPPPNPKLGMAPLSSELTYTPPNRISAGSKIAPSE